MACRFPKGRTSLAGQNILEGEGYASSNRNATETSMRSYLGQIASLCTRHQFATKTKLDVDMDFLKRSLIRDARGTQQMHPKVHVVLPANAQVVAVTARNVGELPWRQASNHVRNRGRHAERQPRYSPIAFRAVPREDQSLLHQRLGKSPWPAAETLVGRACRVDRFRSLPPPCGVSEVHIDNRKRNSCCSPQILRRQFRPHFATSTKRRQLTIHRARCFRTEKRKRAFVEPVDKIERISPLPSRCECCAPDPFLLRTRLRHVHLGKAGVIVGESN